MHISVTYIIWCLNRQQERRAFLRYCLHIEFICSFLNAYTYSFGISSKRIRKRNSSSYIHYPAILHITERWISSVLLYHFISTSRSKVFAMDDYSFRIFQSKFDILWQWVMHLDIVHSVHMFTIEKVGKVFLVLSAIVLFWYRMV